MSDKEICKTVPCYKETKEKGTFTSDFQPTCEADGKIFVEDMSCSHEQRKNCPLLYQSIKQKTR